MIWIGYCCHVLSQSTNSETDGGDILPSYEESFNYPNSDVDNIDKPKIDDSNSNNKKMMTCKYYVYFCVSRTFFLTN